MAGCWEIAPTRSSIAPTGRLQARRTRGNGQGCSLSAPRSRMLFVDQATTLIQETILRNPWIPHEPTAKQAVFLALPHREALFGGAAGGGKSDALLMGGLQFATKPDYAALIDPKDKRPTRVGIERVDGKAFRIARRSKARID